MLPLSSETFPSPYSNRPWATTTTASNDTATTTTTSDESATTSRNETAFSEQLDTDQDLQVGKPNREGKMTSHQPQETGFAEQHRFNEPKIC